MKFFVFLSVAAFVAAGLLSPAAAGTWPQWRGPDSNAVSAESPLPVRWGKDENIGWKVRVPGEGVSSPIVWNDRVFVTSARERGARRVVHALDRISGEIRWSRAIADEYPEITSALTGHAAPTPATDGERVVAFFGNAGLVCYDFAGRQRWRREFGDFESELGFASSPVLYGDNVIQLCDHDGTRFTSFDSFLICLDLDTGKTVWKTKRPEIGRSWSTPVLVPVGEERQELVVNAQDELRGYDPDTGKQLWHVDGMTGWVTPTPVFGDGRIFATSGRNGPVLAVKPGGRGDVTGGRVIWKRPRRGPYVCSPLLYRNRLYVHEEQGILRCFSAETGDVIYRQRLDGKFRASGVAGDGKIYLTDNEGTTHVIAAGDEFRLLAENALGEECLASPAISAKCLFLRTRFHVHCIGPPR